MSTGRVVFQGGSAGGSQPPPERPQQLPSHCQSAPDATTKKKRGREQAKGYEIAAWVAARGKVNVQFDELSETFKSVGQHAAWWDSVVGIHTRYLCEPFYDSWRQVPIRQKRQIPRSLGSWFNLDFSYKDGLLYSIINRGAKKAYSEWKSSLHEHFQALQDKNIDLEIIKKHPPQNLRDPSHWPRCCDRFASSEFLEVSRRNKKNREKQKFPSTQGRQSYTRRRMKRVDPETKMPLSIIKNWGECHQYKDGKWVNDIARETYDELEEERETQQAQYNQVASGSSTSSTNLVDERPIMERKLGKRRGYKPGIGPTLSCYELSQPDPSHSYCSREIPQEIYGEMNMMKEQISFMREVISRLAPDVQLPPMRPFIPPSESSAAPHDDDECDYETEDDGIAP